MRTLKMKSSVFSLKSSAELSKAQITCPMNFFSDDAVFSKTRNLIRTISVLNEAIRSYQNYCGKFVKESFYMSKWTIREISYYWNTCYLFWTILEPDRQNFGL